MLFKRFQLISLINISFTVGLFSQKIDYGPLVLWNISSQTNFDPTKPEDGKFQTNSLGTFGLGAYVLRKVGSKFEIQVNGLYQQKGFQEFNQFGIIGGPPSPFYNLTFKNTFNYISADLIGKFIVVNGQVVDLSLTAGGEYSYLLDYNIASDIDPFNTIYPGNAYQNQWSTHNLSLITSISLTFNKVLTLGLGFNRSITPSLKTENLIIRDWIYTISTGISLPQLFKSRST